ncbi:30S ribosomal protein S20 [Candidatus Woesebacteria bacterium]|nr:30S ribosomal protein S20 [Candidatus Woesebacteria bacterium]MCD8507668.1 30S ribosomal protein S20 [Candidatus Woesebacteria bacterium]MCD8526749.1 30S ribosomal protein S20 [Candidatus Woesebacteria bacterium]MCD8546508.1 30S ribosomal protein S20 [Candidatus Woesebacteria bacterium]
MPILSSAKKALRVSLRKQAINNQVRSQMKTAVKKFMSNPSAEALQEAYSRLDKAVKRNLMHKNTAARRKARMSRTLKQSQSK